SSPSNEQPYPRTFYPGVADRSQATIVEIGLGEKLENIDIRLPAEVTKYQIHGFVTWPDGSLAKGVDVYLEDINYPGWCVNGCNGKTDAAGRFELEGFNSYTYRLVSTADKPARDGKRQDVYGISEPFLLTSDLENIKITIELSGRPW